MRWTGVKKHSSLSKWGREMWKTIKTTEIKHLQTQFIEHTHKLRTCLTLLVEFHTCCGDVQAWFAFTSMTPYSTLCSNMHASSTLTCSQSTYTHAQNAHVSTLLMLRDTDMHLNMNAQNAIRMHTHSRSMLPCYQIHYAKHERITQALKYKVLT